MSKVKDIELGTRAIWPYTVHTYMPDTDATANSSGNVDEEVYWNHFTNFFVIYSFYHIHAVVMKYSSVVSTN